MKKGTIILIAVGAVVLLLVISVFGSYNSLVSLQEDAKNKEADISVMLQRRADLIPNLVSTVKEAEKHEENIFSAVLAAREKLANASTTEEMLQADEELTASLKQLQTSVLAIAEAYPDLKLSTETFQGLMDELAGSENRISVARENYNKAATQYNKKIRTFPSMIIARMFGFEQVSLFETAAQNGTAPQVDFNS